MLNNHRELIKDLHATFYRKSYSEDKNGFDFLSELSNMILSKTQFVSTDNKDDTQTEITEIYDEIFTPYRAQLGPFYRSLYHFIKYTDESEIQNKKKYIDIVQAQMSDGEQYSLLYNGISIGFGFEKLLPLLDKYSFLENIPSRGSNFDKQKDMFYPNTNFKYYSVSLTLSDIN
jgi:hypothetical protein